MTTIDSIMRTAPVIPVLVIDDLSRAETMAAALVGGGLKVLEVTLRTECALEAIRIMKTVPGAIVGAGTVVNERDLQRALDAGADFIVSPGLTDRLASAAVQSKVPFLPGVATAGDIMRGLDHGLDRFKFFPATAMGGLPTLRSLAGPFGTVRFCPTGGISATTAPEWLAHPSVLCVGGTWLTPEGADDEAVAALANAAARLGSRDAD